MPKGKGIVPGTIVKKGKEEIQIIDENQKTSDLIIILDDKIKKLEGSYGEFKTNGELKGFKCIHTETDIQELIKAHGAVKNRMKLYEESVKELNRPVAPVFKLGNTEGKLLLFDISNRLAQIDNHEVVEKLKKQRNELKELMTKNEKRAILFSEINDTLSNLQ